VDERLGISENKAMKHSSLHYAAWMKKNNWRYEAGGGEPINEKPMRLGNF
jgi:hypothetical protein